MQYKTINAAFALFASVAMAIPATGPADVAAVQARSEEGLVDEIVGAVGGIVSALFDDVISWEPYTDDYGVYCVPYNSEYDFKFAYENHFCYTVSSSDGCDGCHLGGDKYPKCKKWLPYTNDDGEDCQPYTVHYDFEFAYSTECYESY